MSRPVRFVLLALLVVAIAWVFAAVLFTQGPTREVGTTSGFQPYDTAVRAERGDIWRDFDPEFASTVHTYFLAPEPGHTLAELTARAPYKYTRAQETFDWARARNIRTYPEGYVI